MTIRAAVAEDLPAVLAIERACNTAAHWSEAEYKRMCSSGVVPRIVIVAEDSALIGFIVARTSGPEWEIENVAVLPQHRGRGIATELVNEIVAHARASAADAVALEVRASNTAARALYRRAGFTEVGRRGQYYSNPDEDAVLYRWERLPVAP